MVMDTSEGAWNSSSELCWRASLVWPAPRGPTVTLFGAEHRAAYPLEIIE